MSERGELAVVVYAEQDGDWRPTQVFTRRWIRFADGFVGGENKYGLFAALDHKNEA